jgi:hypothetical protein
MRNQFQPLLDAMDGVSYLVDAHGTILAAGQQGWQRFAEETDSRDLTVASVVGKSLFGCLDGGPVRKMYSDMHASVCSGRQSRIAFCYRCDGPSTKREMHMSISGVRDSGASLALFQSQVLAEGQRPRMGLFAYGRQAPASGLIRTPALVCSYCHAVAWPPGANEDICSWIEAEDYYRRGGPEDVMVSHGICPACFDRLSALTGAI